MGKEELLARMQRAVVEGEREETRRLAQEAVQARMDLLEVIEKGFTPGIQKVGELWEKGEYFLPELITSAECMKAAMEVLRPELQKSHLAAKSVGKIIIGTIEGDIHDIGKNLVAAMLRANGFEVVDLGADVKLEKFLEKAQEERADCVCLSALLTTTMLGQRRFVELVRSKGLAGRFKVLVGGAPVTQKWADDIGADGYGENAVIAVKIAKSLVRK